MTAAALRGVRRFKAFRSTERRARRQVYVKGSLRTSVGAASPTNLDSMDAGIIVPIPGTANRKRGAPAYFCACSFL